MINFTIPGEPVAKGRPKFSKRGGFVKVYTPAKTTTYENLVKIYFKEAKQEMLEGQLKAEINCYMGMPKSFTKKKRADALSGKLRPTKKPDWDNLGKIICDALNGLAYNDDKDIVSCTVNKWYAEEPRATVEIWEL